MRNIFTKIMLFVAVLAVGQAYAQTETNVEALMQLSAQFDAQWKANQIKVQQYATDNGVAIFEELPDGSPVWTVDSRTSLGVIVAPVRALPSTRLYRSITVIDTSLLRKRRSFA